MVGEFLAPDRAVANAGLGERTVEVQQPHQPRPLAAPVGQGEDRPAMPREAGKHVAGVLPDRLGDDERRLGIDAMKDLDAARLTVNESVSLGRIDRVPAHHSTSQLREGARDDFLELGLRRPADPVGRQPRITAGHENDSSITRHAGRSRLEKGDSRNSAPRWCRTSHQGTACRVGPRRFRIRLRSPGSS